LSPHYVRDVYRMSHNAVRHAIASNDAKRSTAYARDRNVLNRLIEDELQKIAEEKLTTEVIPQTEHHARRQAALDAQVEHDTRHKRTKTVSLMPQHKTAKQKQKEEFERKMEAERRDYEEARQADRDAAKTRTKRVKEARREHVDEQIANRTAESINAHISRMAEELGVSRKAAEQLHKLEQELLTSAIAAPDLYGSASRERTLAHLTRGTSKTITDSIHNVLDADTPDELERALKYGLTMASNSGEKRKQMYANRVQDAARLRGMQLKNAPIVQAARQHQASAWPSAAVAAAAPDIASPPPKPVIRQAKMYSSEKKKRVRKAASPDTAPVVQPSAGVAAMLSRGVKAEAKGEDPVKPAPSKARASKQSSMASYLTPQHK
jgi:hypothetical protein